ncbi:hypothetical protein GJU40_00155 [Bacillus lacus]|uniref:Type III secretion system protein n=1 Tax=Metabacillus lacus TaxID=1983721 RepID=A0A7X2IVJ7_9BACI|nr:EscU/YscU/HrcU family type III secretion system export apparatus switch protein [Metabacillus lacus]MRX70578.1 hypothetical protein [Metabacillus lacus]
MNQVEKRHKAVALSYDESVNSAPRITAKGNGLIADNILSEANKHGVAVHEDPALVSLLSTLEIHQQIPEELYEAVAEIFAFVHRVDSNIKEK